MATNIKFDLNHNPEKPTLILVKKGGEKLGLLKVTGEKINKSLTDAPELSCTINKYLDGELNNLWDEVRDFRLIWWQEENILFEITVEIDESNDTVKSISGVGLAQAELSQINVYGTHINNEDDPNWYWEGNEKRDASEYVSTLYNINNRNLSILHRVLENAPHYRIAHVDYTLVHMERVLSFDFDGNSILDCFNEIEKEVGCVIIVKGVYDNSNNMDRLVYVYDLQDYCDVCHTRTDNLSGVCPKCGNTFMLKGYGEDTTIFITADELGEKIGYSSNTDKVKNCFKLEAGDDDMTAAVRNCNPNGSNFIWHLSSMMREDMSNMLRSKLNGYDELYRAYQTTKPIYLNGDLVDAYNDIVEKYSAYNDDLKPIPTSVITYHEQYQVTTPTTEFRFQPDGYEYTTGDSFDVYVNGGVVSDYGIQIIGDEYNTRVYIIIYGGVSGAGNPDLVDIYCEKRTPIIGYPTLMETYYNVLDTGLYIEHSMMPSIEHATKTATQQAGLLTASNISPVGIRTDNLSTLTTEVVNSNVLDMAKAICDSTRFKITIQNGSYNTSTHKWSGNFKVLNYSDDTDVAFSSSIQVTVNNDDETFLERKIYKVLSKDSPEDFSVTGLYDLENVTLAQFKNMIKAYGLISLKEIYDCGMKACDILVEQGVTEPITTQLYTPYEQRVQAVALEMKERQDDLYTVVGEYDANNNLVNSGILNNIEKVKSVIQDELDLEKYIGSYYWKEFCSYRRDDVYSNSNYTSDGLDNTQLFERALEFVEVANNELYKSAELQHSITSTLRNLLYTDKFAPLLDYFEVGNWLRIQVDGNVYKLRLIEYDIDFDNFNNISVKFSDVTKVADGITDVQDILDKSSSMASSYDAVKRQAGNGNTANKVVDTWFEDGLDATNTRIIGGADNQSQTWDDHGMLFRRYDSVTDTYDDTQMKIINSTLAITTDNWQTVKTAVGQFYYVDPADGNTKMGYGINGEVVIGKLILGQQLGIYNSGNTMKFDRNGLSVENNINRVLINPSDSQLFKVQKKNGNNWDNAIWMDNSGNANFSGAIQAKSGKIGNMNITSTANNGTTAQGGHFYQNSVYAHTVDNDNNYEYEVGFKGDVSPGYLAYYVGRIPINGAWVNDDAHREWMFYVNHAGKLYAQNAEIVGKVTASSGKVGNWNIGSSSSVLAQKGSLYYGTFGSSGSIYLIPSGSTASTTIAGRAGTDWVMSAGGNFGVSKSGGMYATDAHITGTITGSSGEFTKSFKVSAPGTGAYTDYLNEILISANKYIIRQRSTIGSQPETGLEMYLSGAGGVTPTLKLNAENGYILLNGSVSFDTSQGQTGFEGDVYFYDDVYISNGANDYKVLHSGDKFAYALSEYTEGVSISANGSATVTFNIGSITNYSYYGIQSIELLDEGSDKCVVGEFYNTSATQVKVRVNNLSSSGVVIDVKIKVARIKTSIIS